MGYVPLTVFVYQWGAILLVWSVTLLLPL